MAETLSLADISRLRNEFAVGYPERCTAGTVCARIALKIGTLAEDVVFGDVSADNAAKLIIEDQADVQFNCDGGKLVETGNPAYTVCQYGVVRCGAPTA